MAETEYCNEHQTMWFKKGKMKNYAHPIEGTDPVKWCNMPEEGEPQPDKPKPERTYKADPGKIDSIEVQVAVKAVIELWLVDKATTQMIQATTSWIMSKLGNWSSMGAVEETPDKIEKPTKAQGVELSALVDKIGAEKAKSILIDRWHQNETKHLNREQMADFIEQLKKEEEELPF